MNMRSGLASLLLLAAPSVVHADALRVTSYDMDDTGGSVHLESDAPVGEPWVRVEGRLVRVWFPHVVQVSRFDHEREAVEPIRALALRAGPAETAVLRIELGTPPRPVTREDVTITRNGPEAVVSLRVPRQPLAADPPPPFPVPQQPAGAQLVAAQQPVHPLQRPAPAPAPAPAAAPLAAGVETKPEADGDLGTIKEEPEKSSHPILWLSVASLVLGGTYFGMTRYQKKKPVSSSIEVVGTRRLGHRQELLIVRALGQDHLLLCTGGRTECVASTRTGGADLPLSLEAASELGSEEKPASQAGGIGIISRLTSQHRLRKLLDSVDSETPSDEESADERSFTHELYSAAARKRTPSLHSLPSPAMRQSDAVAGITRLRQRRTS
jgi:hypothetical protein